MTLEEQIIDLTSKWYNYVGMDHHKDRDCHWYITKTYSYGKPAKYTASHNGYRASTWHSQEVDNEEDAMLLLINKLSREINDSIMSLKKDIEYAKTNPDDSWYTVEEYEAELLALEGK